MYVYMYERYVCMLVRMHVCMHVCITSTNYSQSDFYLQRQVLLWLMLAKLIWIHNAMKVTKVNLATTTNNNNNT